MRICQTEPTHNVPFFLLNVIRRCSENALRVWLLLHNACVHVAGSVVGSLAERQQNEKKKTMMEIRRLANTCATAVLRFFSRFSNTVDVSCVWQTFASSFVADKPINLQSSNIEWNINWTNIKSERKIDEYVCIRQLPQCLEKCHVKMIHDCLGNKAYDYLKSDLGRRNEI